MNPIDTDLDKLPPGLHILRTMHGLGSAEALQAWAEERAKNCRVVWFDAEFRTQSRHPIREDFVVFQTNQALRIGQTASTCLAYGVAILVIAAINSVAAGPDAPDFTKTRVLAELDKAMQASGTVGIGLVYVRSEDPNWGQVALLPFETWAGGPT